jgi:predicted hotdog family 3-hydroxylacyl-ACP dehydratase
MNAFAALLPHAGSAIMLDELLHWDEREIRARTGTHRSAINPLRRNGRLAAVHLAEYGAQAMAAHGALRARAAGRAPLSALLVSVRQFEASRDFIDELEGELDIVARELLGSPTGWQYEFEAWHGNERIACARVAALAFALPGSQAAAGSSGPA